MNAFNNFLAQEQKNAGDNNFGDQQEGYRPNNPIIRLDKKNTEAYVRILPGLSTQEDPEGVQFSKGFRSVFLNYNKSDGTPAKPTPMTLPFPYNSSVLDPFISNWKASNIQFNGYNSNPAQRYYVNVIPLTSSGGQFQYQTNQQGNLYVAPMELPKTLYNNLLAKLSDEMLAPTADSALNFISSNHAFAVKLYRTGEKTNTEYHVEVYQRQDLGQLPQGWEQLTSDLDKMTEPTEEQSPGFVNFVINSISGTDRTTKNFDFDDSNDGNINKGKQQEPAPTQQSVESQIPTNIGGTPAPQPQAQAPQQPAQSFQPQQPVQAPQQGNVDWNNLAQEQSQPDSNPFSNFDVNNIDDTQVPFETQPQVPQDAPVQPSQASQQPAQPSQPVQQQQVPQDAQQQAKPKSVDDILGGLNL